MQVISTKEEWNEILAEIDSYDFYHTYDYHRISRKKDETPILFAYRGQSAMVAIPFLKRPIPDTDYFDLTSVYGYSGPIYKDVGQSFDNEQFQKEFTTILKDLGVISIFSRLHPYFENQSQILKNLGEIPVLGKVVNIDLTLDLAAQRTQYGKSTKNRTNKCRRISTVKRAQTKEEIDTFIDIYYENMDRLSATKEYYFSKEYFFDFLKCKDFETDILLVNHNETEESMAASMFIKTNSIVQFHLSGTRTKYLKWAPANVFLDEMRIRATEEGYQIFNLGGGLGSREDSLFDFKASFSKDHRVFKVWKYIANEKIYSELSKKADNYLADNGFFPAYRKP